MALSSNSAPNAVATNSSHSPDVFVQSCATSVVEVESGVRLECETPRDILPTQMGGVCLWSGHLLCELSACTKSNHCNLQFNCLFAGKIDPKELLSCWLN